MDSRQSTARPLITEKEFLQQVQELAGILGWKTYHTLRSKGSEAGFPDLVLIRTMPNKEPRLLFVELKSERGKLSVAQQAWVDALEADSCRDWEVYIWRPSAWPQIEEALR